MFLGVQLIVSRQIFQPFFYVKSYKPISITVLFLLQTDLAIFLFLFCGTVLATSLFY